MSFWDKEDGVDVLDWAEAEFLKWHPASQNSSGPSRRVKSLLYSLRRVQLVMFIVILIIVSILQGRTRTGWVPQIVFSAISIVYTLISLTFPQLVVLVASLVWPVPLSPLGRKRAPVVIELVLIPIWTVGMILSTVTLANWPRWSAINFQSTGNTLTKIRARGWFWGWLATIIILFTWILTLFTAYCKVRVYLTDSEFSKKHEDAARPNKRGERFSDRIPLQASSSRDSTESSRRRSF